MKRSAFLFLLFFVLLPTGDSFYNLSFTRIDGVSVALSSLHGRRVILVAIDGGAPDWGLLHALDSVQKGRPDSVAVIAFPALDFDSVVDVSALGRVHDSLGLSLTLGAPGYVARAAGSGQLPLFQWLTTMSRNTHFNRDVEAVGQLFIVSAKGTLYSVIDKSSYPAVLPNVLTCKVWGD